MSETPPESPPAAGLHFHSVSLTVAAVAGAATFGTTALMLSAPAMFLGWIGYSVSGQTPRERAANLVAFLLGIGFGIGTAVLISLLTPGFGQAAAPLAVAAVVVLVLSLRTLAPFNNPLAYFLGLTSFFYSGLAPTASTFLILAAAGVIGALACATAGAIQTVLPQANRPAAA